MDEQKQETTTSPKPLIIHVKVIDGTASDIYEMGEAMKQFKKTLPFKLEALITNDKIVLQDVDALIKELLKLRKQTQNEERFK